MGSMVLVTMWRVLGPGVLLELAQLLLYPGAGCTVADDETGGGKEGYGGQQQRGGEHGARPGVSEGAKAESDQGGRESGQHAEWRETVAVDGMGSGQREREAGCGHQSGQAEQRGALGR